MENQIKRAIALLITMIMLVLSGCRTTETKDYSALLSLEFAQPQNTFLWSVNDSSKLSLSQKGAEKMLSVIKEQKPEYRYSPFYDLDEVKSRLNFNADVFNHEFCALDENGELSPEHLCRLVVSNNSSYLEENDFGYECPEEEYILDICKLIVQVIDHMQGLYPDVDWDRVYCNLGNLKILYNVGMLSYAEVSKDLVLSVSENNTEIVLNMKGDNGLRNVLVHEIMHIIQIGCSCENIENCERRCGICVNWSDFTLNTTDWGWFFEGSAERNMCKLTGDEAVSYQYKMDYLCSLTLSLILKDDVSSQTMESMCFYSEPQRLFDAFGCDSEQQKDEILNMMITLNVLQMQPEAFFEAYKDETGIDPRESEESLNEFCYSLKPDVCITLSRIFYTNLVEYLRNSSIEANDLFFLINCFEGHVYQHLRYGDEDRQTINEPFIESYRAMRNALFKELNEDNGCGDLFTLYADYEILDKESNTLNAELEMLSEDKRDFLQERALWQYELNALGEKVPVYKP